MLLNDRSIRALCLSPSDALDGRQDTSLGSWASLHAMLYPFSDQVNEGVISYGLSHAGYDLRLGDELLLFKNSYNETIDPKRFKDEDYRRRVFDVVHPRDMVMSHGRWLQYIIPPHSYALGASLEYIRMPRHLKGRCVGKSTLARCGILINTTPIEPGWHGHLTIEISNITPCPALIYAREGIAQLEFETLTAEPQQDYEQKAGKYQGQGAEPVPARVKE